MNKQSQQKKTKKQEVTLKDLFEVIDSVAHKAVRDKSSKQVIESAAHQWESDSCNRGRPHRDTHRPF
jgi:mannose/cellobiose epimerase-like protein (N-acyl-D-glucosamine 2-epimerase family)